MSINDIISTPEGKEAMQNIAWIVLQDEKLRRPLM